MPMIGFHPATKIVVIAGSKTRDDAKAGDKK